MILVIDFGSQYTELLTKQVRKEKVFAESVVWDENNIINKAKEFEGIIISGSPESAKNEMHEELFKQLITLKKPLLCICYGMQVIHKLMGGEIDYENLSEFGETKLKVESYHELIDGIPPVFKVWMSHNDSVIKLAKGFTSIAKSEKSYSIAVDKVRKIYTIQFHPEVDNLHGKRIIQNFLFLICQCKKNWDMNKVIEKKVEEIRNEVGKKTVFLAISGGIDSSVVAKLLQKAKIKSTLMFIDHGLICKNKNKLVINYFQSEFKENFKIINAKNEFFERLKGIKKPEEKRNVIGTGFLEIFKKEIDGFEGEKLLAQGTINSDLIESGIKTSTCTIKTHHNTIESLKNHFDLIEPISDLFKDEVRELGKKLNLPDFITESQPFPGPGYAIRIIGEVTEEKVELVKKTDAILQEKLIKANKYQEITQSFTILLDSKAVGVSGDQGKYGYIVAIRAIKSENLMIASVANLTIELLQEISSEITNSIPEITKVVYDISSKPPSTIEWE